MQYVITSQATKKKRNKEDRSTAKLAIANEETRTKFKKALSRLAPSARICRNVNVNAAGSS